MTLGGFQKDSIRIMGILAGFHDDSESILERASKDSKRIPIGFYIDSLSQKRIKNLRRILLESSSNPSRLFLECSQNPHGICQNPHNAYRILLESPQGPSRILLETP